MCSSLCTRNQSKLCTLWLHFTMESTAPRLRPVINRSTAPQHATGLPVQLLTLFRARDPLPFAPPVVKRKAGLPYTGAFFIGKASFLTFDS